MSSFFFFFNPLNCIISNLKQKNQNAMTSDLVHNTPQNKKCIQADSPTVGGTYRTAAVAFDWLTLYTQECAALMQALFFAFILSICVPSLACVNFPFLYSISTPITFWEMIEMQFVHKSRIENDQKKKKRF